MSARLARLLRRAADKLDRLSTNPPLSVDGEAIRDALLRFKRERGLS